MARMAVVVSAYNRADFVEKCLVSILAEAREDLELVVYLMDNGSADNTAEVARAVEGDVRVVRTEDNRRLGEVLNRGIRLSLEDPRVDHIMLMNEDTEWRPGGIHKLMEACTAQPMGFYTPLQLNYRDPSQMDPNALGHAMQSRALVEDLLLGKPLALSYSLPVIIGAALLARRDVWENIGYFDETFWFYGIDDDLCTRARWIGYGLCLVPASQLLHAHGKLGENVSPTWQDPWIRWRKELQARFLFLLKAPDRPLALAWGDAWCLALSTFWGCSKRLWLRGMADAFYIFFRCLYDAPKIEAARRAHYDPHLKQHPRQHPV